MIIPDFSIPSKDCFLTVDKNGTAIKAGDTLQSNEIPVNGSTEPQTREYTVIEYEGNLVVPVGSVPMKSHLVSSFVQSRCEVVIKLPEKIPRFVRGFMETVKHIITSPIGNEKISEGIKRNSQLLLDGDTNHLHDEPVKPTDFITPRIKAYIFLASYAILGLVREARTPTIDNDDDIRSLIAELAFKKITGVYTPDDEQDLQYILKKFPEQKVLFERMTEPEHAAAERKIIEELDIEALWQKYEQENYKK